LREPFLYYSNELLKCSTIFPGGTSGEDSWWINELESLGVDTKSNTDELKIIIDHKPAYILP
jgi:hypothetical protein